MKKTKKLLVAFMGAALISTSFTSCIQNDVSPVVDKIYQNQADLIAAQVAMENADVAYRAAEVALKEQQVAQQVMVDAQTNALNALTLSDRAAQSAYTVAQYEASAYQQLVALETAKLNWEKAMVVLEAGVAEANLVQAQAWLQDYKMYNNFAIGNQSSIIAKNYDISVAKVNLAKSLDNRANDMLALQSDLAGYMADKVAAEAELAALEAMLADPANHQAQKEAIKAQKEANEAMIAENDVLIAEKQLEINDAKDALDVLTVDTTALNTAYTGAYNLLATAKANQITDAAAVVSAQTTLDAKKLALTNYDTTLQTLVDAKATAVTAKGVADAAKAAAIAAEATALTARQAANQAKNAANQDQIDATAKFGTASADLVTATTAYTTANAGLPALQATLTAADAAVITAQAEYDYAKTQYELSQTGFHWGTYNVGNDGVLGIHTDGTNAPDVAPNQRTWAQITAIDFATGIATFGTVQYGTTADLNAGAPGNTKVWAQINQGSFTAAQAGPNVWYNVEQDDNVVGVAPIGNNDMVFDAANTALNGALAAQVTAQDAVDNHATNLATALADYNTAKNDFENKETILAAADAALAAAVVTRTAAIAAHVAAQGVTSTATSAASTAAQNVTNTGQAITNFKNTTKVDMENIIANDTADLSQLKIDLDALNASVAGLQADVDAAQAAIDAALVDSADTMAAQAVVDALMAEKTALSDANNALSTWNTNMQTIIVAINGGFGSDANALRADIDTLVDTTIPAIVVLIDAAQTALDDAVTDAGYDDANITAALENIITNKEAELAALEAELLSNQLLAAKYMDLVNTVL